MEVVPPLPSVWLVSLPRASVSLLTGRIAPDANRTAKISATLEGRLAKLSADMGDKVAAGSTLGLVETPELLDKPLTLRSPVAGVITEKNGTVGELIEKGQVVYTVSDPDRLWLIGEVKERVQPVLDVFGDVPWWAYGLLFVVGFWLVWQRIKASEQGQIDAFRSGERR